MCFQGWTGNAMCFIGHRQFCGAWLRSVWSPRTRKEKGPHHLIRKLLAFPFLSGPHIRSAVYRIKDRSDSSCLAMRDSFEYVKNSGVDSSLWSESQWSMYRQTIRSNNDAFSTSLAVFSKSKCSFITISKYVCWLTNFYSEINQIVKSCIQLLLT